MKKRIEDNLDDFEEYCSNDIVSGKARSYRLAIKYLSEFLNLDCLDRNTLELIKNAQRILQDPNSKMYNDCLAFLSR